MPSPVSAAGGPMQLRGINFGGESSAVEVVVGGRTCGEAEWLND